MRALILALLLSLFVGMAGATNPTPTYNFGPQSGFINPGTIKMGYGTVDNDLTVAGNVAITGTLQAGVTASDTGTIATDVTIAANKYLKNAAGTGIVDFSLGSGIFKTTTGAVTIGPGAVGITGALTVTNLAAITAGSGSAAYDLSASTGAFLTSTGAVTIGTGAVGITGATTFSKTVSYSVNASMTADKTLTSADTKTVYRIDASGGDVTLTLPAASGVTGRLYYVDMSADPGTNYARIKATSGKFGGAAGIAAATGLKNTDVTGGITLMSDGTDYMIFGSYSPVGGAGWVSG